MALGLSCALAASRALAEGEEPRFRIHPSMRVTAVGDDNVFFTKSNRVEDFGVWLRPRVEVGYRRRSLELGADASVDVRRYRKTGALDQEFLRLDVFGEMGILPGLSVRVSNLLTPQPVLLGAPEDTGANLVHTNRTSVAVEYWRELPRGREFEVGVQGSRLIGERFRTGQAVGDSIVVAQSNFVPDFWEGAAWGEIQSPLGRRSSTWARAQFRYRHFDDTSRASFADFAALVGVRTRFLRRFEFSLGGGYGVVAYDSQGERSRFIGEAELRHRMPAGFTWRLRGFTRFTPDLLGNDFFETTGQLSVDKYFGERTSVTISGFVTRFEQDFGRSDANLFGAIEGKIRRQLMRRLQIALSARHWTNGGEFRADDFRQNRILLELVYRR